MSLSFLNQRIIQFVIAPGIAMCNRKEVLFCCTTHCFSLLALIAFILLIKRNPDGQRRWFPCRHINSIRVYWLLSGIPAPCQGCGIRHSSPSLSYFARATPQQAGTPNISAYAASPITAPQSGQPPPPERPQPPHTRSTPITSPAIWRVLALTERRTLNAWRLKAE